VAFAYYERLSEPEKAIYRLSDAVAAIRLHEPSTLWHLVERVRGLLPEGNAEDLHDAAQPLCDALTRKLGIPPVDLEVLEVRPRWPGAELHGLYTRREGQSPQVQIWMRTARHQRPVAFRTFLRTLLHELCHHFDMERMGLPISFHTLGFFKRETSLFHQLVPDARPPRRRTALH
jgi:hypothetical protein